MPFTSLLGDNKSPSWRSDCAEIAYVQELGVVGYEARRRAGCSVSLKTANMGKSRFKDFGLLDEARNMDPKEITT